MICCTKFCKTDEGGINRKLSPVVQDKSQKFLPPFDSADISNTLKCKEIVEELKRLDDERERLSRTSEDRDEER